MSGICGVPVDEHGTVVASHSLPCTARGAPGGSESLPVGHCLWATCLWPTCLWATCLWATCLWATCLWVTCLWATCLWATACGPLPVGH